MKDGESETKISSVSGANRKRKWKEEEEDEEEEEKAQESSDLDTSSDDEGDDEQEDTMEAKQPMEPVCTSQADEPEGMKEEKIERDGQKEEKNTDQGEVEIKQNQKPSQPVVFVPVDRLPEIQVCIHVKVVKHNEANNATPWIFKQPLAFGC